MPAALAHAALAYVCLGLFVPVVQHVFAIQSASVSHVPQVPVSIIYELLEGRALVQFDGNVFAF
jgi:flagellar biosynthesis protein FliQ